MNKPDKASLIIAFSGAYRRSKEKGEPRQALFVLQVWEDLGLQGTGDDVHDFLVPNPGERWGLQPGWL